MSRVEEAVALTSGEDKGTAALTRLRNARQRLYSAAIAFCEGHISEGQLRAVRELLRAHEQHFAETGEIMVPPFIDELELDGIPPKADKEESPSAGETTTPAMRAPFPAPPKVSDPEPKPELQTPLDEDHVQSIQEKLDSLEKKIQALEEDIHKGRINPAQYRAIRRHYQEQRSIAVQLHKKHPDSDRWRVVLEDGKTTFLMQVNETICYGVSCYEYKTHQLLFREGQLPEGSESGISFLGAFGGPAPENQTRRMFGTQTDDGTTLLLIPGRYTAAVAAFSKEPPEWQARALREVHRNFEHANRAVLGEGVDRPMVFPDLSNFIRSKHTES
ncbi:MAG: hypothetical protein PVI78_07955 [Anaerolineales bacterium]